MSVLSVLGIVFVILKLMGSINWSWWFVLAPFYIVFVTTIFVWGVAFSAVFLSSKELKE